MNVEGRLLMKISAEYIDYDDKRYAMAYFKGDLTDDEYLSLNVPVVMKGVITNARKNGKFDVDFEIYVTEVEAQGIMALGDRFLTDGA